MAQLQMVCLGVLCAFALSACSGDKIDRGCPQVAYLRDLAVARDYGRDAAEDANLVAEASMRDVEKSCRQEDDGVRIDFTLTMQAQKGPRLGGTQVGFPFFITILKPDDSIWSKDIMTAAFDFGEKGRTSEQKQNLHVFIPLDKNEMSYAYRVLLGFQLTETQLQTVRESEKGKP